MLYLKRSMVFEVLTVFLYMSTEIAIFFYQQASLYTYFLRVTTGIYLIRLIGPCLLWGFFVAIHYQSVVDSEAPKKPTGTKPVDYRTDRLCAMLHCRDNNNNWWTARRCSWRTTDNHTDTTPTYQTWEYSCRRGRRIIRSPILLHPTFIIYLTLQLMFSPHIFFLYIPAVEVLSVL